MLQGVREQVQRQYLSGATPMWWWVALTVAVEVIYFLAARLSLLLMTKPGVAVFWPAAGISSGTLIALGRAARWPNVRRSVYLGLSLYPPGHNAQYNSQCPLINDGRLTVGLALQFAP